MDLSCYVRSLATRSTDAACSRARGNLDRNAVRFRTGVPKSAAAQPPSPARWASMTSCARSRASSLVSRWLTCVLTVE